MSLPYSKSFLKSFLPTSQPWSDVNFAPNDRPK